MESAVVSLNFPPEKCILNMKYAASFEGIALETKYLFSVESCVDD